MSTSVEKVEPSLHHVLYIEDDMAEIYLMKEAIEESALPLHASFARTMAEAMEAFDPAKHKLVISDYNLPDAQAPEIIEALLKISPYINIITLSNAYTDAQIVEAKKVGAIECLVKGTSKECLDKISNLLSLG